MVNLQDCSGKANILRVLVRSYDNKHGDGHIPYKLCTDEEMAAVNGQFYCISIFICEFGESKGVWKVKVNS